MKKFLFLILALVVLSAHDMFLRLDTYFLQPNSEAVIKLFNGTFHKSENVIARARMMDVSVLGNGERTRLDTTQWSEKDSMTLLSLKTGKEGTYVVGVSTKPRNISMDAEAFNSYLEHDGVLDMLSWRKENDAMGEDAVEKYSKHVKAIYQVGKVKSFDWKTPLDYPIEFVPLTNPYEMHTGDSIQVKLLWKGEPLINQLVYIDSALPAGGHHHAHDESNHHSHSEDKDSDHDHAHEDITGAGHTHDSGLQLRTDENGIVSFRLSSDGIWYLRTIHLQRVEDDELTHQSNWATLTFEVTHSHMISDYVQRIFGISPYVLLFGIIVLALLVFWLIRNIRQNSH